MKICVQTSPLIEKFGVDEAFRMIHEAGFDGVDYNIDISMPGKAIVEGELPELYRGGLDALMEYARPVKEASEKYGVSIHQMHTPFPTYVENETGNAFVLQAIKDCIRVAGYLNCRYAIVHPAFFGYDKKLSPEEEWRVNMERYTDMIEAARESNVIICLENMFGGFRGKIYGAICADMAEANRYINELNRVAGEKRFGFCLDVGHALLVGKEIYSAIQEVAANLVALHVHDNNGLNDQHLFPYMGVLDWDRFTKGLRDAHYRGALSFETFNAIHVIDDELSFEALKFLGATGRMFVRRIEG